MGKGGGEKRTVGYRYHLGAHLTFCHGPVDRLLEIRVDDRAAWRGVSTGGRIEIHKPELFGGETREGGISGYVDVMQGRPDQAANDYLADQAGAAPPGYRGVFGLVLRKVFVGLNPYLKPWAARVQRVFTAQDGAPQWHPTKAGLSLGGGIADAGLYIALDVSGSMAGGRLAAMKSAVAGLLASIRDAAPDRPNDVMIVAYAAGVGASMLRRNCAAADYDALIGFVNGLGAGGGTNYQAGVSLAPGFFEGAGGEWRSGAAGDVGPVDVEPPEDSTGWKRRVVLFLTDGAPEPASSAAEAAATLAAIRDVEVFAVNIGLADTTWTEMLDNTAEDGVPVIGAGNADDLRKALEAAFAEGYDMNPAHIVRECLTNSEWGLGYAEADIGDSFEAVADALFDEGFGMSLAWRRAGSIEDFLVDVLRHIDGNLYVDRRTGRWEINLVRADYDAADLPVFDESNVIDWGELGRRELAEAVNAVTVTYSDRRTEAPGTRTVSDPALVQRMGQVVVEKVDYPGVRTGALAARLAARDLRALSAPLLSGRITVNRDGADLHPGDAIVLTSARRGLNGAVMRVAEVDLGDARSAGIGLRLVEDAFAIEAEPVAAEPDYEGVSDPRSPPSPAALRLVEEAPYLALVRSRGQAETDAALAGEPELGYLHAAAAKPSGDALSATVAVDAGAGYEEAGALSFAPAGALLRPLPGRADANEAFVTRGLSIRRAKAGDLAAIGGELVRIDAVEPATDPALGPCQRIVIGRGCLDTPPRAHPAGTALIVLEDAAELGADAWLAGEAVSVKLRPVTGLGALPIDAAPADVVEMDARAIRPYPPGRLRLDGAYGPENFLPDLATADWAHRDRRLQTTGALEDATEGDIGPEAGTTYRLELRAVLPGGDVFGAGDPWRRADIFADDGPGALVRGPIDLGAATSWALDTAAGPDVFARPDVFDAAAVPDAFGVVPHAALYAEIAVTSRRDGHASREPARVRGRPLAPPVNLQAVDLQGEEV